MVLWYDLESIDGEGEVDHWQTAKQALPWERPRLGAYWNRVRPESRRHGNKKFRGLSRDSLAGVEHDARFWRRPGGELQGRVAHLRKRRYAEASCANPARVGGGVRRAPRSHVPSRRAGQAKDWGNAHDTGSGFTTGIRSAIRFALARAAARARSLGAVGQSLQFLVGKILPAVGNRAQATLLWA